MLEEKTLTATEFKAKCLELMDDIVANRLSAVTITKRGKVVARMVAGREEKRLSSAFGSMKGSLMLDDIDLTQPMIVLPDDFPTFP
jgi:antitoxin (DNA-binding transcriptional repressor) of toxin-antitoxin stability system